MTNAMRSVFTLSNLAIRVGVQLVGQFNDGPCGDPSRTKTLFSRMRKLVRALPPSQFLSEQLQANLDLWPQMWERGEFSAARYQMVHLVRKLRNYRDDWEGDSIAEECKSPSPIVSDAVSMVEV